MHSKNDINHFFFDGYEIQNDKLDNQFLLLNFYIDFHIDSSIFLNLHFLLLTFHFQPKVDF